MLSISLIRSRALLTNKSLEKHRYLIDLFFKLLRSGLWEEEVRLTTSEPIDFEALFQIAEEQSVVGIIAAALEHVEGRKITKSDALPFLKRVFGLESRNESMNVFIASLTKKMRKAGIYSLLLKGQGVAQCYNRPLWRACGDIDLLLDSDNYLKAKAYFSKGSVTLEPEGVFSKHLGIHIDSWTVELHGTCRVSLSSRINRSLDEIQANVFNGDILTWHNGDTDIFLPGPNEDAIFIFTHFLNHFYKGGIGLRQICDWCRLLWTYRDSIDPLLLKSRLRSMGLISEWRAFAAFAVDCLGMPIDAMPLINQSRHWSRKAHRIQAFILKVGNFGRNRDMSYYDKYPYLIRKSISFGRRCVDLVRHAAIFPLDSLRFFLGILYYGLRSATRGE